MNTFPCEAVSYEGPSRKTRSRSNITTPPRSIAGKTMADWFRFGCAYWHTMRGTGADPFGVGTAAHPWDDGSNSIANAQNRARVFFDFLQKVGIDYYCFHDRDVAPECATLAESNKSARRRRRRAGGGAETHRQETPLGHRLPVRPSALSAGGRHQSRTRRSMPTPPAQVKKAHGSHPPPRRRGLYLLGRPRRLHHPAQHRHEARTRPPRALPPHGGGLQEGDRLQGPVLHRAQAAGTDHPPIRLRRRRLPQFPPRIRPARALQAQHRDQPRHARRPHDGARTHRRLRSRRARQHRCQHGHARTSAGTPTSSRPTSISPPKRCSCS